MSHKDEVFSNLYTSEALSKSYNMYVILYNNHVICKLIL
jgi:hypothetical protein